MFNEIFSALHLLGEQRQNFTYKQEEMLRVIPEICSSLASAPTQMAPTGDTESHSQQMKQSRSLILRSQLQCPTMLFHLSPFLGSGGGGGGILGGFLPPARFQPLSALFPR